MQFISSFSDWHILSYLGGDIWESKLKNKFKAIYCSISAGMSENLTLLKKAFASIVYLTYPMFYVYIFKNTQVKLCKVLHDYSPLLFFKETLIKGGFYWSCNIRSEGPSLDLVDAWRIISTECFYFKPIKFLDYNS